MSHESKIQHAPNTKNKSIEYKAVSDEYMSQRQLKKGVAGWVLLASLGISYVISGDFAGWNFGLELGGFGGMLIATLVMGLMYICLVLSLAEMSSSLPTAGGGYSFARRAMGPWGGFLTGTAILLEYAIAPAAIAIFIGGYVHELVGIDGPIVYAAFYVVFVGLHLWGAGEALRIMMGITLLAVIAIGVFMVGMVPHFDSANLFDIAANPNVAGSSSFLPEGYMGIWAALPFAMWLFLAVEGVPLAAEEAKNPAKDMPKGIIASMLVLIVFAAAVLLLAPGGAGAEAMKTHGAPLVGALQSVYGQDSLAAKFVNIVGLFGLIASFFSIIYAYSRQVFALSRAGYLPRFLSLSGKRKVPVWALIVPGILGFLLSLTGEGDLMITMAVFGATISYAMMSLSHILLRKKEPNLERPYKTPGGIFTSSIALVLSLVALASTFVVSLQAAMWSALFYLIMVTYFVLYSRHRLVASAPEEEFDMIASAESELN
ncbi:ethanolamine permease [Shewanella sp. Choline-02u-19]|jgi:ethanolamine permease|uniref:ethanolamine permease n=1 Tax=unclassified Shewanella TaxID=196818 RepID=UPI000C34D8F6|nr:MULTISPECIES: ethanolamine permease [unclassified Shewanella]PKG56174.1 ethanolamine permease [Shewanella sp. GutDb-MelDb]PKH58782.1 ethanolamine permease [Shewanella sp. Bg11-22]PKI29072.1 ethanolamine permease [Shewanella sp. Choline-02u-19]